MIFDPAVQREGIAEIKRAFDSEILNVRASPAATGPSPIFIVGLQVRQPIYSKGVSHWKRFERHLEPLIESLGEATLQRFDGVATQTGRAPGGASDGVFL